MSRNVRMTLSYLALLVFNLFALASIVRALFLVFGGRTVRLTIVSFSLGNVALIALAVAIAGVAFSSSLGFALSRSRGGRSPFPQIIPAVLVLAALGFLLFSQGLLAPAGWIFLAYLLTAAPVCCWQLQRAYAALPSSLDEAAAIDGCGSWRFFYAIIFPAVAPALLLSALFSFLIAGNDCFVLGAPQPENLWTSYSVTLLFAALLLGFGLWLFGRSRLAER
ncbi:MAG TPA: hypothetical protein VHW03_02225 [Chthoniobacterales bacterium]|jgi:ABC-type maltose transport system permease subunit|nr:hypothetical protein [Chthoniobacterales bacterium]